MAADKTRDMRRNWWTCLIGSCLDVHDSTTHHLDQSDAMFSGILNGPGLELSRSYHTTLVTTNRPKTIM